MTVSGVHYNSVHPHTTPMHVTLDGEVCYPADVLTNAEGVIQRWNGFIATPLFSRETAAKLTADINGDDFSAEVEATHFVWVKPGFLIQYGWDGTPFGEGTPKYERTVIAPDVMGRYAIGSWSWVWGQCAVPAHYHHEVPESEQRALYGDR